MSAPEPGTVRLLIPSRGAPPMAAIHDPDPKGSPHHPWRITGRGRMSDTAFDDPANEWYPLITTTAHRPIAPGEVLFRPGIYPGKGSIAIYAPDAEDLSHRQACADGTPAHWLASAADWDGESRWLTHVDVVDWISLIPDPTSIHLRAAQARRAAERANEEANLATTKLLTAERTLSGVALALRAGGRFAGDDTPLDEQVADLVADSNAASDAAHDSAWELRRTRAEVVGVGRVLRDKGYGLVVGDTVAWLAANLPPYPNVDTFTEHRCGYSWASRAFGQVTSRWRCPLPLGHEPLVRADGETHGSEAFPLGEYVQTLVSVLRTVKEYQVFADYSVAVVVHPESDDVPEGAELTGYGSQVLIDACVAGDEEDRLVRYTDDRRVVTTAAWQTLDADASRSRALRRVELTDAGRSFLRSYALMVSA